MFGLIDFEKKKMIYKQNINKKYHFLRGFGLKKEKNHMPTFAFSHFESDFLLRLTLSKLIFHLKLFSFNPNIPTFQKVKFSFYFLLKFTNPK